MCPTPAHPNLQPIELDLSAAFSFEHGFGRAELLRLGLQLEQARRIILEASITEVGFCLTPHRQLLADYRSQRKYSLLGKILALAKQLRESIDCAVILGPPQLMAAAQSLFAAGGHPHHNNLSRGQRGGRPRIYFAPAMPDNDAWQALVDILPQGRLLHTIDDRWGLVAIDEDEPLDYDIIHSDNNPNDNILCDNHGRQLLAGLFSFLWDALQTTSTASDETQLAAAVGPEHSPLMTLAKQIGLPRIEFDGLATISSSQPDRPLPPPAFGPPPSFFHPGVLLAGSVMGLDIVKLLHGAEAMWERFAAAPPGNNLPLDFAGLCCLLAQRQNVHGFQIISTASALNSLAQNLQQSRGDNKFLIQWIPAAVRHDRLCITMSSSENDDRKKRKDRLLTDLAAQQAQAKRQARHAAAQPTLVVQLPIVDEASIGQLIELHSISAAVKHNLLTANS